MTNEEYPWPARRPTLADVARRAGVSPALVSIVMRDAPGASDASRKRIQAVARELGYRPDLRARSLASLRAHVIGVVFGHAGRFHSELLDELYAAAETRGWNLVLSALTDHRDERRALDSLADSNVDALIMLGPPVADPLLAGRVPLVVVGWHVDHPQVDVVRTSDRHGMTAAVEHLVQLGHRRIAHFQGGEGLTALGRLHAYRAAMREAGLEAEIEVVRCEGEDQIHGQRAAAAMVAQGSPLPTAFIAFNDDIAAAAMTVLAQHGLTVPADASVVGFDNSALARSPGIDLTSVGQEPRELARHAVERVVRRAEGAAVPEDDIVLEPVLQIRGSTGPVRPD